MLKRALPVNAPLRGIKNINEYNKYNKYIFSIFGYILDAIEDGTLKEKEKAG